MSHGQAFDEEAALAHLGWLRLFEHGCAQLTLSRGGVFHATHHGDADSLLAELRRPEYRGSKPQISVSPRPARMLGERRSANDSDIELITNLRLDFDPLRPLGAAPVEEIRAEFEQLRQRAQERGKPLSGAPVGLFRLLPAVMASTLVNDDADQRAEHARRIRELARIELGAELADDVLGALVSARCRAARGQSASESERELAFAAANLASDLLERLGAPVHLAVDSGNGVHLWLEVAPIDVRDDRSRRIVKAGQHRLEELVREHVEGAIPGVRVDAIGGLSTVTRLAGGLNTKGTHTAERPHRPVAICMNEPRGDGVALRDWILRAGTEAVEREEADLAARKREVEERMRSLGGDCAGEPRNFEKRLTGAIERQLERAPIDGAGHDDALRAMLSLAGLLVRAGTDDYRERFAAIVRDAKPHHWPSERALEREIEKALGRALKAGDFGGWRRELLAEDAGQDAAKREFRSGQAAAGNRPERRPQADGSAALDAESESDAEPESGPQHAGEESPSDDDAPDAPPPSNVRRGPWPKSGGPVWKFPEPPEEESPTRTPQAVVPEPAAELLYNEDGIRLPPLPKRDVEGLRDFSAPGIASRIFGVIEGHHESLIYDGGRFYVYQGGRYIALTRGWLDNAVQLYHGARNEDGSATFICTVAMRKCVLDTIRVFALKEGCRDGDGSFFDGSRALAVFTNGAWILALDGTPKWVEHSPKHRALHRFEFDYERGLEPTHLLAVMRDWFAGTSNAECDARITLIRQYFGHALLNSLHHLALHVALLLIGKGHDGKSTLINILRKLMPPGSTISMDPAALASKAHTSELNRAMLHGKRANLCGDIGDGRWESTAGLKSILSHEPITGRRIGADPFTFRPTLASVFAGNALPRVGDKSHGFFRRWRLVEFNNSVPAHARDERLEEKLLGLERQAIACWFMDAALAQLNGSAPKELAKPRCHEALLQRWIAGDDSVATFVRDYTVDAGQDKSAWTPTSILYDQYAEWCRWAYGTQATRETRGKQAFATSLGKLSGVRHGRLGKACTRVVSVKVRTEEGGS